MTLKILCKLSTETKRYSSHTILQNFNLPTKQRPLLFDGDSLTTAQQQLAVLNVTARRSVPTTNAADPAVVDNSTVVAQRRHHPSNTTLSRSIWSTIHAAAAAVVDDPAGRSCTEDSATSKRPQRPLSMIRSRGMLSPKFNERSTANSTCVQSTHQLTYF